MGGLISLRLVATATVFAGHPVCQRAASSMIMVQSKKLQLDLSQSAFNVQTQNGEF